MTERSDGIAHAYDCPNRLRCSLGFTKDQLVPPGSHVARVRERASSWVPLFRTLMESKGKGRGKLASDREGFVTCHMGTQFCFRVYVSVF
ncbi:uncharacterized protein E5676_scaffold32G00820 [Cucumis melo var. makuwa]|uniref:Uncharacterized protein n=1 Tax=Cucumis melo var. makuwa TaxID=1194695 RepID=A0A5A7TIL5_CUCMM|nr:uncharacterized protein E6C27_scaffold128G002510 [Cucumis melo var. makuwa]TYK16064.1 uncharacterized protein E5676_scaffold32G00820 [Cucumis melo var. makuwa]